jgi:hypothetical protein
MKFVITYFSHVITKAFALPQTGDPAFLMRNPPTHAGAAIYRVTP